MKSSTIGSVILCLLCTSALAESDKRQLVEMPEMMQEHMLANMRNHLETVDEILRLLTEEKFDKAAELAEFKLGMSSLDDHGAKHMAQFMPEGMRATGTNMHKAASRFALKAQEGEAAPTYKALTEVTSACVACHAAYRIR